MSNVPSVHAVYFRVLFDIDQLELERLPLPKQLHNYFSQQTYSISYAQCKCFRCFATLRNNGLSDIGSMGGSLEINPNNDVHLL